MKRLITICVAVTVLLAVSAVPAFATFVQTIDVYTYSVGGTIDWQHTYDHSADPVLSASLTIVADDVDGPGNDTNGEQDMVLIKDKNGTWHDLGLLNNIGYYTDWNYYPGPGNPYQPLTTTVFDINPLWLNDAFPVEVKVETSWGVEIETSKLTVVPVPEPATICLLALGGFSLLRKR
jgi:hypothetical protein